MAYQGTPTTGLLLERGPSGKSLSPYTSPRHSRRGKVQDNSTTQPIF